MRSVRLLLGALAVLGAFATPGEADEARFDESGSLGFCWASPTSPESARPDRMATLEGLPGPFVLTAPIPWGWVEPAAPTRPEGSRGLRPTYRWDGLDDLVRTWQGAGFSPVLVLTTGSPWACEPPEACEWPRTVREALDGSTADVLLRESRGATPPRADAWSQWERYVEDVVERYDGDGILDMRGLRAPIRGVQVLDRAHDPDRWLGSTDDYLRLLHHAETGGRRAYDGLEVVLAAVDLRGLGAARPAFPDAEEMTARRRRLLLGLGPAARLEAERGFAFCDRTLEMPRLVRAVAVRGTAHPADEVADVAYVRHLLDEQGASTVEVWLEETPARKHGEPTFPTAAVPDREEAARRRRWVPVANSPAHADFPAARRWLETGVAYDLVRSVLSGRVAGATRVFVAGISESPSVAGAGEDLVAEGPGGGLQRAPSWYAARQWLRHAAGTASVREIPVGSQARAAVLEFPPSHGTTWEMVLLRDPNRSWAGDPLAPNAPATDTVTVKVPAGSYLLEETLLEEGDPVRRGHEAPGGALSVALTPAPLYVIPVKVEGSAPR